MGILLIVIVVRNKILIDILVLGIAIHRNDPLTAIFKVLSLKENIWGCFDALHAVLAKVLLAVAAFYIINILVATFIRGIVLWKVLLQLLVLGLYKVL